MVLENLALFIGGVENRIEKNKKNTVNEYDFEILHDLGFRIDISKIYIKTWVLSNLSVRIYLEQTFLIEFENMNRDYVFDTRKSHLVEKDFFSNGKIDLVDFRKVFNVFWNAWEFFVMTARKSAYYYLKNTENKKIMEEFKSKISIGCNW